jgi:hypothetical protein
MIGALGAGLAVAACAPAPPAPAAHANWYNTEVHVAPDAVAGSYTVDTACKLADATTSTHTDTLTHVVGDETIKTFTWPEPDPIDCTATETAGPPMTTPTYWLTGTAPAPFGTPPTFVPITAPTAAPQTCHETIIGTYNDQTPPLDYWDCIFTVKNT